MYLDLFEWPRKDLALRDGAAGKNSYRGGRYLLDGAKGADVEVEGAEPVLDLNFLYHPSCRDRIGRACRHLRATASRPRRQRAKA